MSTRWAGVLLAFLLILPSVFALSRTCTRLEDPARVMQSLTLCADNYYPYDYPEGVLIEGDNLVFDCNSAVLHGKFKNSGIVLVNRENVTIKNCQVANYETGILIKGSKGIVILDSRFIRNYYGIKLIDSTGVVIENSDDISIKKPVQLINSAGNILHFVNKDLEGEQCRLNQCNMPSGFAAHEYELAKEEEPKRFLRRILNDAIRAWIFA